MQESTPLVLPAVLQEQDDPRDIRGYFRGQQQMDIDQPVDTPTEEYPPMESTNDLERSSPVESRIRQESSDEDDVPLRDRRLREFHQKTTSTMPVQEHRSFQKPAKGSLLANGKIKKKPGPQPWAAKPIAKNDMKAKMEVIRAIEKNWGKNFITNYIPKCHRPLQKKKGGKRTAYRQHELDPKKWLPSVLKALLGISYLTTDKAFLKKAMNDIVRHRIKHTGNRKPQLVTTDFDVIEDMITRGWDIETSFSIRYKHLLLSQPKGYLETDEDIDHILACGDDDYQRTSDIEGEDEDDDEDDMEVDGQEEEDSTEYSSPYAPKGAYIHGAPHQPPKMIISKQSKPSKPIKKEKPSKPTKPAKAGKRSEPPNGLPDDQSHQQFPPHMYGGYGIPPYGPYSGYPGYPMVPVYPPPNTKGFPPMPPMYPWPGYGQHPGHGYQQAQQDKDGNVQDPRAQAHGYPPYGFPGYGYAQPQQENDAAQAHGHPPYGFPGQGHAQPQQDKEDNAQSPRAQVYGYPPYGFPGQGYPGMPPYPHPMSPAPSLPPATPAPSAATHSSGHKRFSPFRNSKRSASSRPDAAFGRYDASGHSRAPRVKREPGVEDHPIAIQDHDKAPDNDRSEAADQTSPTSHENEIAEAERYIETIRARIAAERRR